MIKDIYLAIYILIHPNLGIVHTAFHCHRKHIERVQTTVLVCFPLTVVADPAEGPGEPAPPPLFLDENEARWVEKNFFEARPPVISGSG